MKKPKIRFKGYQEDWEQRKFADFTWDAGKRNKEDLDLEPYAITNEHGFIRQRDAHDDFGYMKDTDRKAYNIVQPNSFAYNPARINVGSIGYYKGVENVIVSSLYEVFQTDNYVNDRFLWHWLKSDEFPRWIEKLQEGSVRLYFYYDKLCECQLYMPSLEEQEKIATFLDDLDHLITLHQRKCEETKTLKKYMLQKMFPQNGHSVPEIRFSGFTEDWEQRKLVDLVDRVTRKNQDLVSELPLTISAQYGLIDQNEFFDKRVASKDVSGYYLIENGEFAYNKSTSTDAPWGAIKRLDRYKNGVLSTLYIVFGIKENNPVDSDFLVSYYSTNLWHKGIHEIAAEGARNHGLLNIAPADFFETKLMIPQDIEEQKKIGKYFEELERLITLHHRKYMKYADLSVFDWEQRKLGELGSLKNGMNFSKEAMGIGFPFVNLQNIFGNNVIDVTNLGKAMASDSQLKDYNLLNGDVLFVRSSVKLEGVGEAALVPQNLENTTYSGFIIRFRDEYGLDNNFKRFLFGIESVRNQIMAQATNSANKNISQTVLENLCLKIPNKSEQEKIGLYFSNLDHLITLHHRKQNYVLNTLIYAKTTLFITKTS